MAEKKFTTKQEQVINTRDKNVLVSAAAGSGKTTVLVQRIICKITGESIGTVPQATCEPVDIDKILVLTFTNAAAAQMKERIEAAISKRLAENPTDANLSRQAVLIHNAHITTIHSFCLYLLRNHFSEVGIDPAFRIAPEGEVKLVEGTVAEQLINELFETNQVEGFLKLADRVTKKNTLDGLVEVLLSAYRESRNAPYVEEYIEDRRKDYECNSQEQLENSSWMRFLMDEFDTYIDEAIRITNANLDRCREPDGAFKYIAALEEDLSMLIALKGIKTYQERYDFVNNMRFAALRGQGMKDVDKEVIEEAKSMRETVKKSIKEQFVDRYFFMPSQLIIEGMKVNNEIVNILMDVLTIYIDRLKEEKNKRKIIDFADMEHYALEILVKRENRKNVPTQVALEYSKLFDEIMVDEYQDSNRIQEEILEVVSGKINSRFNRFMVGDVKQSIYSFRQACPDIFIDKYDRYAQGQEGCERIDLAKNFRSRTCVIESINDIFERIMNRDLGMVTYDASARLYNGADYPQDTPLHISELLVLADSGDKKSTKEQQEALLVANRINEMITSGFEVYDFDTKSSRPCRYSDIVILLRSSKGWDEQFKSVLEANGIPAFVASKTGYFSSLEVRQLMALLEVLDNPRQEIPLFGVMTGPFGGFSDEEIACIRTKDDGELYDALCRIGLMDMDSEDDLSMISRDIIEKSRVFLDFIGRYRERKVYTLIHVLISQIIDETGYLYMLGSLPYGEQRKANIYMLIEKAKQYEAGSFKGLYHFVRYIEQIREYSVDFGEAVTLDEKSDVVRIMTIHSSKGLEFPICFVSSLGKQYNIKFTKEDIIYDNEFGIGLERVDIAKNIKRRDLRRAALIKNMQREAVAEEMRILYVALTRAKEKLIMTGVTKDVERLFSKHVPIDDEDSIFLPYYLRCDTVSYLSLLAAAIGIDGTSYINVDILEESDLILPKVIDGVSKSHRRTALETALSKNTNMPERTQMIEDRISFRYPYEDLADLCTKTSVSELKLAAMGEELIDHDLEEEPVELFDTSETAAYIPSFEKTLTESKGATRGSAYHRVMELLDFSKYLDYGKTESDMVSDGLVSLVDDDIASMVKSEKIDMADAALVSRRKVARFLVSELGQRMCAASIRGNLHLEEPFVLSIEASRLDTKYPDSETVLIQGIIDAFFEEDDKTVLMDYKTDRIESAEELIKRYHVQLEYYKEALVKIRGAKVDEMLIYSFALEKTIKIR